MKCQQRILCQNRHRGLAVIVETHPVKHKAGSYMSMFSSSDNQNTLERWDSKARQNIRKKISKTEEPFILTGCAKYDRIDRGCSTIEITIIR